MQFSHQMIASCGLLTVGILAGCGGSTQQCQTLPESISNPEASKSDQKLFQLAQSTGDVDKLVIGTNKDGEIEKIAVYHSGDSKLPAALKSLSDKHFANGKTGGFESEYYKNIGEVDELEVTTAEGQECEVAAKKDGSLAYTECKIEASAVKAELLAKVNEELPGHTFVEAEEKTGLVSEVTIKVEYKKRTHRLRFDAEGNLFAHTVRLPATVDVPYRGE